MIYVTSKNKRDYTEELNTFNMVRGVGGDEWGSSPTPRITLCGRRGTGLGVLCGGLGQGAGAFSVSSGDMSTDIFRLRSSVTGGAEISISSRVEIGGLTRAITGSAMLVGSDGVEGTLSVESGRDGNCVFVSDANVSWDCARSALLCTDTPREEEAARDVEGSLDVEALRDIDAARDTDALREEPSRTPDATLPPSSALPRSEAGRFRLPEACVWRGLEVEVGVGVLLAAGGRPSAFFVPGMCIRPC